MGRRSRKRRAAERAAAPAAEAPRAEAAAPARRAGPKVTGRNPRSSRSLAEGPPQPPWHPFPLVELCIFIGLVVGIAGFVIWGRPGQILVGLALILITLATLEFTLREHIGGYRSHTTLLAGVLAIAAGAATFLAGTPRAVTLVVVVALFAAAFVAFREVFKRRSGGLGWRGGLR